jgi:hypothetical protein
MGCAGFLMRAFWMVIGSGALVLLAMRIAHEARWSLSGLDAAYWATVVLLLVARTVDARWLGGRTADGQAVTPAVLRRYGITLAGASATGWVCAQALQLG